MGRSMGRHAAFELAANSPEGALKGVIIESGRSILGNFCHGVEPAVAERLEAGYRAKVASIRLPALVIHGELDTLAPVAQAREMYESFASEQKRILTIPGAGPQRPAVPGHQRILHGDTGVCGGVTEGGWWAVVDSNHWPLACRASALTN